METLHTAKKLVIAKQPINAAPKRRGRPVGSKNKAKKAIRAAQRVNRQAANLDRDGLVAALGLLLVAVDILKQTIN